jgi:hypothetical protein
MAKIIKMGSQNSLFIPKSSNISKTTRVGHSTNPFKFNDFEGNTLNSFVSADIFEGTNLKKENKLKLIASSVTGSMNKMRSNITEPIVNFVNRVRTGISNVCDRCGFTNAWDYAKNTNISDLPVIKSVNEVLTKPINIDGIKNIGNSVSNIGKGISSVMSYDVTGWTKGISDKWSNLISRVNHKKYTAETPVSELETSWKNIIEQESNEVA